MALVGCINGTGSRRACATGRKQQNLVNSVVELPQFILGKAVGLTGPIRRITWHPGESLMAWIAMRGG